MGQERLKRIKQDYQATPLVYIGTGAAECHTPEGHHAHPGIAQGRALLRSNGNAVNEESFASARAHERVLFTAAARRTLEAVQKMKF